MKRRRPLRGSVVLAWLASLLAAGTVAAAAPSGGSEAQRLHDQGVQCMDVIERNACAITHFEALLQLETRERELVTDAMMRLIDLYRDEGRSDDVALLLRQFWDVGMKRESHGHVPYSTRFMPTELDIMAVADLQQLVGAKVFTTLSADAQDSLLTCDEARREQLEIKRRFRRAETKAAKDGGDAWVVMQAQRERDAARRAAYAKRKASGAEGPIFVEALCPVARALGQVDLRSFGKAMGAQNHHDARLSVGIATLEGLAPLLAAAEADGRLIRVGPDHFIVPDLDYAGGPVHVLQLDHDEVTIAPGPLVQGLIETRAKRGSTANRELLRLAAKVPRDAGFFFVMTQAAMREIGFGGMKRSTRGFLEALLPKPGGLQVAAMFGDSLGLFTRVPTDTPGKSRVLVSVANLLVAGADDDESKAWLDGLDIAESEDRKAVLASFLISPRKLEKLMLQ